MVEWLSSGLQCVVRYTHLKKSLYYIFFLAKKGVLPGPMIEDRP